MSNRQAGWLFVAAQFALLATLIVLPTGAGWRRPTWLTMAGIALVIGGLVVVAVAASHLGESLTATPEPKGEASLRTGGLYRFARHPIYSGVLLIVVGLVVRSGSFVTLAVGVATVVFFDRKAAWEERRLTATYPGYAEYARITPRFLPRRRR